MTDRPELAAATGDPEETEAIREISPRDPFWASRLGGLIKAVVVPRPIAWVSSRSADGLPNLAPHSYFMVLSERPPLLGFVSSGRKDTLRNIEATRQYVVNIADEELIEALNLTSADFPSDVSEFPWAGLSPKPSRVVSAPRVGDAPVSLELELVEVRTYGEQPSFLIVGEIVHIRVAERVLDGTRVAPERLRAVGRHAGSTYSRTTDLFDLERPTYRGLLDRGVAPTARRLS